MKILIATTKTEHHKYFLNNLKIDEKNLSIIFETKLSESSIYKNKKLLKKKNQVEKKLFSNHKFNKKFNKKNFKSINSLNCINFINDLSPNIIILFGTQILKKIFLHKINCKNIFNLHGGNPEDYRGLDTLFWTIYHKDFNNLYSTLHKVNPRVDTGDIIEMKKIKISKDLNFFNIGYYNTQNCVDMVNNLIKKKLNNENLIFNKQKKLGRYYSKIPYSIIKNCYYKLQKYVKDKYKNK